ncbi:recombinase family protein [Nocardia brasiliensis]|uniref:recombinase family protein n=1 Tax=Nocardia brasiliensis TaxID=37326 RepID=UPI00378A928D
MIYARVSKDDAGGRSCREQINGCTEDCKYEEWQVLHVLEDNDRGASRHSKRERPDFQRLPTVLKPGHVLVVWEPSRITRDPVEFGPFCDVLAERDVPLYYDGRLYDMNDDDDRARVWQDILDGAKQAGKTRKRVIRALSANQDARLPHGKKSPGLRIVRDDRTGKPVRREIDPVQARILTEAARLILDENKTPRAVGRLFEDQWRASGGGAFRGPDVKRILTNPTLFGIYAHYGEELGEGQWPAVLDRELYPLLRRRLCSEVVVETRGTEPKYLLTSIARCTSCLELGKQGKVDHKGPTTKQRHGDRYICAEYNHVARNMARVDAHVEEVLLSLLERPSTRTKLLAQDESETESIESELSAIKNLRDEINAYVKNAARTRMSAESVAVYVEELEADIRAANARVDAMTQAADPVLIEAAREDIRELWASDHFTLQRKREIIRRGFDVRIVPVERRGRYSEVGVQVYPARSLAPQQNRAVGSV